MGLVIQISTTVGFAWLGGLVYLLQDQRPQHRPFSRRGWPYTLLAALCIAAVTTLGVEVLTRFLPVVPAQVLAFAAPVGTKAAKATATRKQSLDQPTVVQRFSTLGVALALEYLDGKLSEHKDELIYIWSHSGLSHEQMLALSMRAKGRLGERRLPGTQVLAKQLEDSSQAYDEAIEQFSRAQVNNREVASARTRAVVAAEDLLSVIYDAHLDRLVRAELRQTPSVSTAVFVMPPPPAQRSRP